MRRSGCFFPRLPRATALCPAARISPGTAAPWRRKKPASPELSAPASVPEPGFHAQSRHSHAARKGIYKNGDHKQHQKRGGQILSARLLIAFSVVCVAHKINAYLITG